MFEVRPCAQRVSDDAWGGDAVRGGLLRRLPAPHAEPAPPPGHPVLRGELLMSSVLSVSQAAFPASVDVIHHARALPRRDMSTQANGAGCKLASCPDPYSY